MDLFLWKLCGKKAFKNMAWPREFIKGPKLLYLISLQVDHNIILNGSPGAGKTTVGQAVAKRLGLPVLDMDNDILESVWGMPVSQKVLSYYEAQEYLWYIFLYCTANPFKF